MGQQTSIFFEMCTTLLSMLCVCVCVCFVWCVCVCARVRVFLFGGGVYLDWRVRVPNLSLLSSVLLRTLCCV